MTGSEDSKVSENREMLVRAQQSGWFGTLGAYTRLSGPGWLQSAITLGGGSLAGSLFLGVLGGTKLLWLQLVAIAMGVVMLSAISYVTLSTGQKPFQAINKHINPVLGWGWLIATVMANVIWCMPQFSLCYAALRENLIGPAVGDSQSGKLMVSAVILAATFTVVLMNRKQGVGARLFDLLLKALVGMIVLCFFGVVIYLTVNGNLNWGEILSGFIPDLSQATNPTGDVASLVASLPESLQSFWSERIVKEQRAVMIGAAATAVGINMTFLLPYSMLNRGWDKPFRGLARFDLCTGMAIPYIIVTSCVVIASAASFHAKIDDAYLSQQPEEFVTSPLFMGSLKSLQARLEVAPTSGSGETASLSTEEAEQLALVKEKLGEKNFAAVAGGQSDEQAWEKITAMAELPEVEKRIASTLVQRTAFQLSESLA
ncbi:MAG: divalent metal cation transporter, partial [Planctomycetales bacterium]|nr:divalent metal cation transporter [Planctomycetales bacterium]